MYALLWVVLCDKIVRWINRFWLIRNFIYFGKLPINFRCSVIRSTFVYLRWNWLYSIFCWPSYADCKDTSYTVCPIVTVIVVKDCSESRYDNRGRGHWIEIYTVIQSNISWLLVQHFGVQTFLPIFFFSRRGKLHQFIVYCLLPLDPEWFWP